MKSVRLGGPRSPIEFLWQSGDSYLGLPDPRPVLWPLHYTKCPHDGTAIFKCTVLAHPKVMPSGILWSTSCSNQVEESQDWLFTLREKDVGTMVPIGAVSELTVEEHWNQWGLAHLTLHRIGLHTLLKGSVLLPKGQSICGGGKGGGRENSVRWLSHVACQRFDLWI